MTGRRELATRYSSELGFRGIRAPADLPIHNNHAGRRQLLDRVGDHAGLRKVGSAMNIREKALVLGFLAINIAGLVGLTLGVTLAVVP